ncbi:MAG TPA: isopentenyl-diphosphate Delta-isomerase [Parapedobacter sp.]|uniref:isopentenyl-diphosphate Delta-isomerase n=1 Tax=Parapedobacter sp. TaxID=1958893 RepID=UPI002C0C9F06|nr:isopentenyl-diphosphate Delta-isomerase [Parapedobacter sp.]HWK58795.1 isopentenyl-diphosphate Delta-isomerase [Parapedobacter sp.]
MEDQVILVDEQDRAIGTMEKLAAHREGLLHRAISVFIFDDQRRLLLHKRASHKYHSANLWTNTCCSHPAPGEHAMDAAHRRLYEEMGMEADLAFAFTFQYRAAFDNGLTEYELDHVFIGHSNCFPAPNPAEVADYRWLSQSDIEHEVLTRPDTYTAWFKLIYQRVFDVF